MKRPPEKRPPEPLASVRLTPCPRTWESLEPAPGSAAWRSCDACRLHVHDVAQLSAGEAQRLIQERDSRLCLHILRRPDGSVVTREEPAPVRRQRWVRRVAAAASWLMICFGVAPGCDPQGSPAQGDESAATSPGGEPRPAAAGDSGAHGAEAPNPDEELRELSLLGYMSESLGGVME